MLEELFSNYRGSEVQNPNSIRIVVTKKDYILVYIGNNLLELFSIQKESKVRVFFDKEKNQILIKRSDSLGRGDIIKGYKMTIYRDNASYVKVKNVLNFGFRKYVTEEYQELDGGILISIPSDYKDETQE